MTIKRHIVNCCLLLILLVFACGVLITAANYLPIKESHKSASLEQIGREGLFPEVPSMDGEYGSFHSMNPTTLDLATDSLMLKMALYEGEDAGIIQAFRCYSTQYEEEYSRYWHGYVVVLRLLLLFFDYHEIRILNGICQSLLVAAAAFYMWRQKGVKYALALASSYVLLMPMALANCLQYSWVFYVSFGFLFIYLRHRDYWESENRYIYYFILVGGVTIFLDLLTYPLLAWGLLITWCIILQEKEETMAFFLKRVVFSGISWIIGYGCVWIGKWALGSIILRENLFKKAFSEAVLWTVNEGDTAITLYDRFRTLYTNWSMYNYNIYLIVLAVWLLYWVVGGFLSGYKKSSKAPALLLVSLSSIVWYVFMAGHTTMHHIFTYRIFGVSIAAFIGMILLCTETNAEGMKTGKQRIGYWVTVLGTGVLSVFLMLQLRDSYSVRNSECSLTRIEVDAPVSMAFTPAYENVTLLNLGFWVQNGEKGYGRLSLLDGEDVAEQVVFPLCDCMEGNFNEVAQDWKLKAGHPYTLLFETIDKDGQVYLWVTSDNAMPMAEYGEAVMGDKRLSGQILGGITYWCGLTEGSKRLLFVIAFMGMGLMLVYSVRSILKRR